MSEENGKDTVQEKLDLILLNQQEQKELLEEVIEKLLELDITGNTGFTEFQA